MARTWPTVTEFQRFLYGAGVLSKYPPTGVQASQFVNYKEAIQSAIDDFEQQTTIRPFLADGSEARIQYVQVTGSPTGGTFVLSYAGATTSALAYNASAAAVQAALVALSTIGTGKATVSGDAGGPYTVTLDTDLWPYSWLLLNTNSLTGGSSPSVTVDEEPQYQDGPRNNVLDLRDSWWSIRSLTTGRQYGTGGQARVLHTDHEYIRRQGFKAIEGIRPYGWWGGGPEAVEIIGRRGFTDDLFANVKQGVMGKAATYVIPQLASQAGHGGALSWTEGDVSEKYGNRGAYSPVIEQALGQFDSAVMQYGRTRVYAA